MKCMICDSRSDYYFSKDYIDSPFSGFMAEIGTVTYHRCVNCGFVFSKTHAELDKSEWEQLNHRVHHYLESDTGQRLVNQPPYAEQALSLSMLGANGIIDLESMIDYAAGYGSLSKLLEHYFGIRLPIYDPYVNEHGSARYVSEADLGVYKTVLNSAMFEHAVCRDDLDAVNQLVDAEGVLILHTLICENIPRDPNWFYLAPPVHTAFHTNASMEILMKQWGYRSSVYSPKSKSWVLFRNEPTMIVERLAAINRELQSSWFIWKNGFVDYWKGF